VGGRHFKLEQQAVNEASFRVPDEAGWQPQRQRVDTHPGLTLSSRLLTDLDAAALAGAGAFAWPALGTSAARWHAAVWDMRRQGRSQLQPCKPEVGMCGGSAPLPLPTHGPTPRPIPTRSQADAAGARGAAQPGRGALCVQPHLLPLPAAQPAGAGAGRAPPALPLPARPPRRGGAPAPPAAPPAGPHARGGRPTRCTISSNPCSSGSSSSGRTSTGNSGSGWRGIAIACSGGRRGSAAQRGHKQHDAGS
jgi:hypothetical protein